MTRIAPSGDGEPQSHDGFVVFDRVWPKPAGGLPMEGWDNPRGYVVMGIVTDPTDPAQGAIILVDDFGTRAKMPDWLFQLYCGEEN